MAAHLVQRDKAVVAVEGGVLEALGHHRAAILLHVHGEARDGLPAEAAARLGYQVSREQTVQEVKDARVHIRFVAPRMGNCPVNVAPVRFARLGSAVHIGAVDREAGDDLFQCSMT